MLWVVCVVWSLMKEYDYTINCDMVIPKIRVVDKQASVCSYFIFEILYCRVIQNVFPMESEVGAARRDLRRSIQALMSV